MTLFKLARSVVGVKYHWFLPLVYFTHTFFHLDSPTPTFFFISVFETYLSDFSIPSSLAVFPQYWRCWNDRPIPTRGQLAVDDPNSGLEPFSVCVCFHSLASLSSRRIGPFMRKIFFPKVSCIFSETCWKKNVAYRHHYFSRLYPIFLLLSSAKNITECAKHLS